MRRLYNGFQSDPCIRYDVYSPSRISATTLVSVYVVRSRVTRRVYGAYNVAFEQCEELAAHYNRRVLYRMSRAVHDVPDESGLRSTPRFAPTHTQPPALIRECVRACVITVPRYAASAVCTCNAGLSSAMCSQHAPSTTISR